MTVSGGAGQSVNAGSFSYTNTTANVQQIGKVIVSASNPAALASLTLSVSGTSRSATVAPVMASDTLTFSPPITVGSGDAVTFILTAETAGSSTGMAKGPTYAALLELGGGHRDGGGPLTPLGGGALLVGLMLLPLGNRKRRRAALIGLVGLLLMAALTGCGGSSSSSRPSGTTVTVLGNGTLSNPVLLSTVSVTGSAPTAQQLTGLGFQ